MNVCMITIGSFTLTNILRFVVLNYLGKFQVASDDSNLRNKVILAQSETRSLARH